jgi:hypothetical protein
MLQKTFIPYGGYFSSPFARWQGSMANENAITLGAATAKRWLEHKNWDPKIIDYLVFGITIHQIHGFYARIFQVYFSVKHVPLRPPASGRQRSGLRPGPMKIASA